MQIVVKRFVTILSLILTLSFAAVSISPQENREESPLPSDVHPDTRSRLSSVKREDLNERSKKAYDAALAESGIPPQGVGAILLHLSGRNLQYEWPLGWTLPQLAIITAGREFDQPYEWSLHRMQALAVGLDPAVVDIVRDRKPLAKVDEKEAVVIQIGREIFETHKLRSDTYARAVKLLGGETNLVDIVDLMADYSGTAVLLTAFNQQMPPGWAQTLPLPFTPPDDIHSDSRNRLPLLPFPRGGGQSALYGRTLAPAGTGPIDMRRHGAGIKFLGDRVGRRTVDLAILASARECDSQYDWTITELAAMKDGLEPAIIDVVRNKKPIAALSEKDASVIRLAREVFKKHNVTADTYSRALQAYGERDLVDLVDLMAQHTTDAALLAVFDQHLPPGQKPLLPIP